MSNFLNIGQVEQFLIVAREGSFGKAAASLSLSQPTLTRNIRALEADLGTRLFDRGARGAELTAAGRRLLLRAEALVNDAQRLAASANEDGGVDEQVRIGISPNFYFDVLEVAVGERIRASGSMSVQVVSGTRETIVDDLRRNAIDLGLCLLPDFFYTAGVEYQDIAFEQLDEQRILPYVSSDHPAAGATALADVVQYRWAVPHHLSVSYRFESAFYRNNLAVPRQAVNASSLSFLRSLALNQALVTLLPERVASADVAAGLLRPLDIEALHFRALAGLMLRKDRRLTGEALPLADAIRAAFQERQRNG